MASPWDRPALVGRPRHAYDRTIGDRDRADQPFSRARPMLAREHAEEIEGIGPAYAAKLAEAGVKTTDDLLERGASA